MAALDVAESGAEVVVLVVVPHCRLLLCSIHFAEYFLVQ